MITLYRTYKLPHGKYHVYIRNLSGSVYLYGISYGYTILVHIQRQFHNLMHIKGAGHDDIVKLY